MNATPDLLSTTPNDADKIHEQGLVLARQRRFDEAVDAFQAALAADPENIEAIRHLAQANADAGRLTESEKAWLQYLARCPDSSIGHRHLGNLRKRMEKFGLAIESHQQAVKLDETSPALHVDLGIALAAAKRLPEARKSFSRALELDANYYDAHINLGMLLQEMREGKEALAQLRRAIELRPDDPSGHNNLGVALGDQEKFQEAIECYEGLLARWPDYALAWNNMGNALRSAGRSEEAVTALHKALELKPDYTEAHNNLGIIYIGMGRFLDAVRAFDQSLLLRPDYPEAHANRGLIYLLLGEFHRGWADYEWRWQGHNGRKRKKFSGRVWDGSPIAGKRLLLYCEQGLGDTFQFVRYAKELKARGATIILECPDSIRQILDRTPGIDEFIIRGDKPPLCDFYAPLLSLPGLCQTHLDNLPRRVPYIFTDPALIWEWKQRMASIEGFRIGIAWQGNPEHKGDRYRSFPLKRFAVVANTPGVTLVTLQKNYGSEQIERLDGLFPLTDFKGISENIDGWLRTAAIISNLDLVICADTSLAHLAGAMGIPVWMTIPVSPDWRWLLDRTDTPWYPTMRLFRQSRGGDWEEVFDRIANALRERLRMSSKTVHHPATDVDQQEAEALLRKVGDHLARNELAPARALLGQAIRLDPTNAGAHQDLGVTHAKQGRVREAIACFRRALELAPDSAGLYANLGLACFHAGQLVEAVAQLRKAIWLGASSADTHKNLARALTALPDPAAAEESYWAALKLKPDDAEAHYHLAVVMLMQGKFEQGWLEYEWRWRWRTSAKRHLDQPRWAGQTLNGKRIVFLAEQDTRDTVQYARYADLLSQQGAKVILECQPTLAQLMKGCLGVQRVITAGSPLPPHDFQTGIVSLPAILSTTLLTLPAARPYLGVHNDAIALWRERLQGIGPSRIAIALEEDEAAGIPGRLSALSTLLVPRFVGMKGLAVINLQPASDNRRFEGTLDLSPLPDDPADRYVALAAALVGCDLLITVDNTIAHIAGAIGVPTWVALPTTPEFRWLLNRDDTPWYPTMRLFRQRRSGDWDEVADRISRALQANPPSGNSAEQRS